MEPVSEIALTRTRSKKASSGSGSHMEKHSKYGDVIRDVIIGFADGLTVPFALTAGLSSYVSLTHVSCLEILDAKKSFTN